MSNTNDRVNIATVTTIALIHRGATKIDAVDAVTHRARLRDEEAAAVVREVNKILK